MKNVCRLLKILLIVLNASCSSKQVIDSRLDMPICVIGNIGAICSDGRVLTFDKISNWFLYSPEDFKVLHKQLDQGDQCLRYEK